ncbi:hypothetical protein SAMN07250955_101213 [Arboricoccus pini]|uniref:Lipoprotein n=1 Tax=Arboricoccus pini TaxID=1963835 RepID=A0A212PYR3_9PROT|nr:hypothetical protein SAMN07250955_101213 [Arboricoccus pini]
MVLHRRRVLLASLGTVALLGLAGCETDEIDYRPNYSAQPSVTLAVGNVQIVDQRQAPAQTNFVDARRSNELTDETKRWLAVRVRAGGGSGSAKAVVEQASVTERLIPDRSSGFFGWMGNAPTYALEGNLAIRIIILDEAGQERVSATAHVGRSRSVGQRASVVERDNEARRLMADLIQDMEPNLKQTARQNLGQFATVSNDPTPSAPTSATATPSAPASGTSAAGGTSSIGGQPYPPAAGSDTIQSQSLPSL